MKTTETKLSGAVTYWSLTSMPRDPLMASWRTLGLEKYVPDNRTPLAALKKALIDVCQESRRLVRPLNDDGYAVVIERPNDRKLDYTIDFTATINPTGVTIEPPDHPDASQVKQAYANELGVVPAWALAKALVKILDLFQATRLRDTGGIYWVPDDKLKAWEAVALAIESGGSSVYHLRTAMDEDAVKAVAAAVTAEIESELAGIQSDLKADAKKGSRALRNRADYAGELQAKAQKYEKILGVTLEALKNSASEAENQAAAAALASFGGR